MSEKKNLLSVLSLVLAALALGLSVFSLVRPAPTAAPGSPDSSTLIQQIEGLQAQVNDLTARLEAASQVSGLADWTLTVTPWSDGEGASVAMSAVPAVFEDGVAAFFCVRLGSAEISNTACKWDGEAFTATTELSAQDGYSFYCILLSEDGVRRQYPLSTPENPVDDIPVYLGSSLRSFCNMTVDSWLDANNTITLTAAYIQVQLPRISASGTPALDKAQLILTRNNEELSRQDITLNPGTGDGSFELALTDLSFDLPELGDEDYLDLWLEVTLADGSVLSCAGGSWYNSPDGLFLVVG